MRTTATGITLLELIITLSIISIIFSFGVPSFRHQINNSKLYSEQQQLVTLLNAARVNAVDSGSPVTICPRGDNDLCGSSWSQGYLAFIDRNGDRILDTDEPVIFQFRSTDNDMQIRWRAFGVRSSLQWLPSGMTNHQNGTFEICLNDDPRYARALIITKAGRVRRSKDTNGNGIHENAKGEDIRC